MTQGEFEALNRALADLKVARAVWHDDRAETLIRLIRAEAVLETRLQLTRVEG